jgi:glycosyltransferase involved in cell wall biosynthesis
VYNDKIVFVAVSSHNDAKLIVTTIRTMPVFLDHIIVVDDMKSDETAETASAAGDRRAEVVRHEVNMGVGGAIISGHRRAMEIGGDIDVVMAGDAWTLADSFQISLSCLASSRRRRLTRSPS